MPIAATVKRVTSAGKKMVTGANSFQCSRPQTRVVVSRATTAGMPQPVEPLLSAYDAARR